ncbi:MAG: hypothetical protein LBR34_02410 [Prevotella sp.]|jgi:hypothetical protein|nr:hypothetical protein [Prevotella sp.]
MYKSVSIIALFMLLQSCSNSKVATESAEITPVAVKKEISFAPGPHAIVYKTLKNYADNVPVIMDKSRTKIVSYPAPSDVYYAGKLAKPTALKNGYLLDNRGINEDVAFLKYTYEEYSRLQEAPSMKEMLSKIIDPYPLEELIDCGLRSQYNNEVEELNLLIYNGFNGCRKADITPVKMIIAE